MNDEKIRKAFEKTVQYKNAHSPHQSEERYFLFEIGYKFRDEILAEVNLNNAGKIAELELQVEYIKEDRDLVYELLKANQEISFQLNNQVRSFKGLPIIIKECIT